YCVADRPRGVRRSVFIRQLQLGREVGPPFVVHGRVASEDVRAILREHGQGLPGLLHSFTGSPAMAEECLAMGYYIAVGGMLTFKNAGAVRDRKSTRLNSSHVKISYAVFCLKKKIK